jgi:UDP-N-acetylglucosamine 2-epimerase (non-hydrolysing)
VPSLIFTGQHAGLEPSEFGLNGFSSVGLDCPGEENPHDHVRKVTAALAPLLNPGPDLLLVQGDTSTALGAAIAGFMANVPVAHVEAGLRTHDRHLPWPEEEYRTSIDSLAELLFAPTIRAAANLGDEGVPGQVHVTGNTGVDAVLAAEARLPPPSLHDSGAGPRLLVTCHRRESWREGICSIAAALAEIASRGDLQVDVVLHPNAFVAGRMRELLGDTRGVSLIEPCSHGELIARMRDADLVLSDSGGIQEEAPALGVPLLVLREKTERPEGLEDGSALLVGTSTQAIVTAVTRLLDDPAARAAMSRRSFPYGDGRAARRIAQIIDDWFEKREELTRGTNSKPGIAAPPIPW